ncbi:MAG: ATP-binding protein [Planctomycetota bacterium]
MMPATIPRSIVTHATEPDWVSLLRTYNDVAERLKRSHEALAAEVHRLRDELREKNRELQRRERLAALGRMAAGVAHEIRNPLGGIGLYSSLLERDLADRPAQREIARRISDGVQNMEGIIRDILAFAGGAEPKFEEALLAEIVARAVEQTARAADQAGVSVEVDGSVGRVGVRCDPGQIERALVNLICNAIEAVDRGGQVWVRAASPTGVGRHQGTPLVSVSVEDNGPGIDPAVKDRVFHPFFTTKDSGTGLGLAIVHGIAEAHGGEVRAESRIGGGTSMVLRLPAVAADPLGNRRVIRRAS